MTSLAGAAVLAALLLAATAPAAAFKVTVKPASVRQGDVAMIVVTGTPSVPAMDGSVAGRPLFFFPYADGYAALIGVDLESKPGKVPWHIGFVDGGAPHQASGRIAVAPRRFPVQRLSLPKGMVDLSPANESRAEMEAARLRALYDTITVERLWRGRFTKPVASSVKAEGFGFRRVINGKPRAPHSGVDFAAPAGTPVVAANRGRVALVAEHFFGGRLVALDHGEALYTLYMHLERIDVTEGALVEKGAIIGAVGSTGRATGPHLHWAAQLRSARIDPQALLTLPVGD
ncbi:MAG TPA: M23 family metallopeptidase [Candidatus Bathyarchaeia archaeon]|nr:M23 family metallopeptidase [Candidatus Bathyarchaeia archaeon]